ncbi:MAG: DUF362 domain-containing protein [Tissierellia bacterium]|nr:DUF362 domain-containing protein [Bacillota bacterium]NLL22311.1 DUF362 domain-containing protein [Tissierellia bacterium]
MPIHIFHIETYDAEAISHAVEEMFSDFRIPVKGKNVVLKVNLLRKAAPDQAVTTHPAVVEAVASYFTKRGARVTIADSPGGPSHLGQLMSSYRTSGMEKAAKNSGASLNRSLRSKIVTLSNSATLREFPVLHVFTEADILINVAKLKTHGMMTYTGAVKNLFGVIAGLAKASHHFRLQEPLPFAQHLVELAEYVDADYHIIDGIVAMEGNGPGGGDPRACGVLLGSQNPHSLDKVACEIAGIPFKKVPTLLIAEKMNLLKDSEFIGELRPLARPFTLPDSLSVTFLPSWIPAALRQALLSRLRPLPAFHHNICIGCGKCADICPAEVISIVNSKAHHTVKGCISCFCCAEVCPVKAIGAHRPLLSQLFEPKSK